MFNILEQHKELPKEEINELITEYQKTKNVDLKDKIIRAHIHFAYSIVRKYSSIGQPWFDDYMQTALHEISNCIEKIDLTKSNLTTYSYRVLHWRLQQFHNWKFPTIKNTQPRTLEDEFNYVEFDKTKHDKNINPNFEKTEHETFLFLCIMIIFSWCLFL